MAGEAAVSGLVDKAFVRMKAVAVIVDKEAVVIVRVDGQGRAAMHLLVQRPVCMRRIEQSSNRDDATHMVWP